MTNITDPYTSDGNHPLNHTGTGMIYHSSQLQDGSAKTQALAVEALLSQQQKSIAEQNSATGSGGSYSSYGGSSLGECKTFAPLVMSFIITALMGITTHDHNLFNILTYGAFLGAFFGAGGAILDMNGSPPLLEQAKTMIRNVPRGALYGIAGALGGAIVMGGFSFSLAGLALTKPVAKQDISPQQPSRLSALVQRIHQFA